jgi:hypothetical protein
MLRSSNRISAPATRSFTVLDTSTSFGRARPMTRRWLSATFAVSALWPKWPCPEDFLGLNPPVNYSALAWRDAAPLVGMVCCACRGRRGAR